MGNPWIRAFLNQFNIRTGRGLPSLGLSKISHTSKAAKGWNQKEPSGVTLGFAPLQSRLCQSSINPSSEIYEKIQHQRNTLWIIWRELATALESHIGDSMHPMPREGGTTRCNPASANPQCS